MITPEITSAQIDESCEEKKNSGKHTMRKNGRISSQSIETYTYLFLAVRKEKETENNWHGLSLFFR